jgi:rhodanese-related sulfurtransferase
MAVYTQRADEKMLGLDRLRRMFWWLPVGRVPEVSAFRLREQLSGPAAPQILDVRTAAEWRRSHIEGAVSVPIQTLGRRLPELGLDPAQPVVAICLSAHRSIPAVRLLRSRGFDGVAQLQGGMLAWWREELPVVGTGATDQGL